MALINIVEHKSPSYGPRTYANAAQGDFTIAFAVDFFTAGERLTKKAAQRNCFIEAPLLNEMREVPVRQHIDLIINTIRQHPSPSLNIAGNGIYTLTRFGFDQARVNVYIYEVLKAVHQKTPIREIICGGQTGADIAGAVAAKALGIPCIVRMPRGFRQRFEDGVDVNSDPKELCISIHTMAKQVFTAEESSDERMKTPQPA